MTEWCAICLGPFLWDLGEEQGDGGGHKEVCLRELGGFPETNEYGDGWLVTLLVFKQFVD
jgi:hypothetical protein